MAHIDGKENDEINIEGIPDYEMPHADEIDGAAEFHLESEDDSEDNADEEAEYSTKQPRSTLTIRYCCMNIVVQLKVDMIKNLILRERISDVFSPYYKPPGL